MEEPNSTRRLAAILAADVAGYTRLMEQDSDGTVAAWQTARDRVIDPVIAEHSGRIVKHTGDGFLAEFSTVQDAVLCAITMQNNLAQGPLNFRMGVHLGDIIDDGQDIHGEGVNIAARIESIAEEGGINISGDVYNQVRNRIEASYEDRGGQEVRNVSAPVQVYAIRLETDRLEETTQSSATAAANKPTIAVLPFTNMSGDPEQEYFSDGITEDIITELSRNKIFSVTSRNTVFTFKGAAVEIPQVAADLGVRYVLEGSVRKAGNRVRITGQLIEAATDVHVWSERYDRELEDIFEVQDEITRKIIGAIAPGILSAESQRAHGKKNSGLDAWDCIMRAHWHIRRFAKSDMAAAKELLDKALALDPRNATAYTDIAFAHHFDAVFGWTDAPLESHAKLGNAALKAVELDDQNAYAHTILAIYDLFSGKHDDAVHRLNRAKELDPNLSFACGYLGTTYAFSGDWERARPHLEEAIKLSPRDPLLVVWHVCLGWAALLSTHHEEAATYALQAIQENPNFADNYSVLAAAYGHLGRTADASGAREKLLRHMPDLTLDDSRLVRPFRNENDRQHFLDGLQKAGVPES
jgi:adenylate cyclase